MSWETKAKNAEAVTTLKTKIFNEGGIGYILTPDYQRILVGELVDQELIYQEAFNNWELKVKIET